MICTKLTKKAMDIMCKAHEGQLDKGGVPYVFHPIHVAEQMTDEETTIVALLHDVVEDTPTTLEELSYFGEEVIEALSLLTRTKNQDYFEYIKNLSKNEIARKVKLADLKHNADLTRLSHITEKDLKRREKYLKSINYLESIEKIDTLKMVKKRKPA